MNALSPGAPTRHKPELGYEISSSVFTMSYSPAAGWHEPRLVALDRFAQHPGTAGLHYGEVAVEGLRAFRRLDTTIAVFRPWEHARRFRRSAAGAAMPELPDDLFVSAVEQLVEADASALTDEPGSSLYLRSVMFAADQVLVSHRSTNYGFVLMAWPGGGSPELDGDQSRRSGRLDGANLFAVRATHPRAEVVLLAATETAPPGVMSESVLTLASRLGYIARQEQATPDQWRTQGGQRNATEAFRCSTMHGIAPIPVRENGGGAHAGPDYDPDRDHEPGPVTAAIRQALTDIQCGRVPAPRGWMYSIPADSE